MLEIKNLSFSYGDIPVLNDISIELEPGITHGLLGPNGSGKTTLFQLISGTLKAQKGTVQLDGSKPTSKEISYLQTQPHFYSLITGREYLELHRYHNTDYNIEEWNTIFELPLHHLIDSYSSGMKKKLALMALLCLDRPIMLLDEPFNNLDLEANQFLVELIRMLANRGKTILLSSHFLEVITTVSDRILLLKDKTIAQRIAKEEISEWADRYESEGIKESIDRAKDLL